MDLKRDSPIPLYYQLHEHFRSQIQSGDLKAGDRLPSEEDLIEDSGLSRFTVRQAFQSLEREGYIERIRGKGTFVRVPRVQLSVVWQLLGFAEDMEQKGHTMTSEIEAIRLDRCRVDDAARNLQISREAQVVHFDRRRVVDGVELVYESVTVRADLCPGLEAIDLAEKSLLDVLQSEYKIEIVRAQRTLGIESALDSLAEGFGIKPRTPVFMLTDLARTANDVPVFYARSYINPRRGEFVFDLFRNTTGS